MKRYRISLNGTNFLFNFEETTPEKYGFFTTRWVKATNANEAETRAIGLIKKCPDLTQRTLNQRDDPPMIYVEEIVPVGMFEYLRRSPGRGYTFYPEDADDKV
ncbi:hypothetical protein [Desulfoluna butyratoxydans]|uniref:hypothetical protein n=1 Tax=Desulfoluna butyratoxydans TaxID=231438 RepID=UPI0015D1FE11|nr:hypothetical protein [Desulfoluna butyratoxydans]